jgi:hypothetical protein
VALIQLVLGGVGLRFATATCEHPERQENTTKLHVLSLHPSAEGERQRLVTRDSNALQRSASRTAMASKWGSDVGGWERNCTYLPQPFNDNGVVRVGAGVPSRPR